MKVSNDSIFNSAEFRSIGQSWSKPRASVALVQTLNTLTPYFFLLIVAAKSYGGHWIIFATSSVLASLYCIRVFILLHDCGHQSFHPNQTFQKWLGRFCGVICFTPYEAWTKNHHIHHRHLNRIDQKIPGEIITLSSGKYRELSRWNKLVYHVYRHPMFFIFIGGIGHFLIVTRVPKLFSLEARKSIMTTNTFLVLYLGLGCYALGTIPFLVAQGIILWMTSAIGTILFYIQHQFEHSEFYPEEKWKHAEACFYGSSYFKFPQPFQWFTGNIGHHHIHHLFPRIPNYHLGNIEIGNKKVLKLTDVFRCFRLKIFCEESKRLVPFK